MDRIPHKRITKSVYLISYTLDYDISTMYINLKLYSLYRTYLFIL